MKRGGVKNPENIGVVINAIAPPPACRRGDLRRLHNVELKFAHSICQPALSGCPRRNSLCDIAADRHGSMQDR